MKKSRFFHKRLLINVVEKVRKKNGRLGARFLVSGFKFQVSGVFYNL
jgi:hypothetical protein